MSTASSDTVARIRVRISSSQQPHIRRHCPRCATDRRFVSSGKFRVNAQRKTIDVWLIFLCTECDTRWNLPIHERRPVRTFDPAELEALMHNDPVLAQRLATAGSMASEPVLTLAFATPIGQRISAIEITIAVAPPSALRLDRLLAMILGLRRAEILSLSAASHLRVTPPVVKALRRIAVDGQMVRLDLRECRDVLAKRCRNHLAGQYPSAGSTGLSSG